MKERIVCAFSIILSLGVLLLNGKAAHGYDSTLPNPTPTPNPDAVEEVSRELYCPLCTGVRLDNCDLPLCDQMREVIRQKLADGETEQEIKAYFVEQYGETVTGIPPKRGGMILVWVLPFLALFGAGGWVFYATRYRAGQGQSETMEFPSSRPLPVEYVERVERDLERYG